MANPITLRSPGSILLISCYELGHQPLGVALPLGFLERAGFAPGVMDIAVESFDPEKAKRARFVGISVPMHTALRLGVHAARLVREVNPDCHICFYGLYAVLNADYLLEHGADSCIGGESETPLLAQVEAIEKNGAGVNGERIEGVNVRGREARPFLQRLPFAVPSRGALPPLEKYAHLEDNGDRRVVGYVEASRGCLHVCTHCPITPVYGGRFFILPREVVLEDIRQQARAGATHITFGDPDFLNGPTHSLKVVRAMHQEFPALTFDFTAKVEHVLNRGEILPELGRSGCLFMVSAVESLSNKVLDILEKNHTRADIVRALEICREAGILVRPTWVPFTPWTTLEDYLGIFEFIEAHGLIDRVDPVQYTIRLLIPPGTTMLKRPELKPHLGPLDQASFYYTWKHPDPRMDRLQKGLTAIVEKDAGEGVDPAVTFYRLWEHAAGGRPVGAGAPLAAGRPRAPRLSEPWY